VLLIRKIMKSFVQWFAFRLYPPQHVKADGAAGRFACDVSENMEDLLLRSEPEHVHWDNRVRRGQHRVQSECEHLCASLTLLTGHRKL